MPLRKAIIISEDNFDESPVHEVVGVPFAPSVIVLCAPDLPYGVLIS